MRFATSSGQITVGAAESFVGLINRFNRMTAHLAKIKTRAVVSSNPILSISFDDFPKSAWTRGGAILEDREVKATYYAAGRFCGKTIGGLAYFDRSDLMEAAAAGHEIGCHSYSHKRGTRISSAELRDDYARNREFLSDRLPGVNVPSFAYPHGDVSARVKAVASAQYRTARGIWPGVNVSPIDLALLKSVALERRSWTAEAMEALALEGGAHQGLAHSVRPRGVRGPERLWQYASDADPGVGYRPRSWPGDPARWRGGGTLDRAGRVPPRAGRSSRRSVAIQKFAVDSGGRRANF